MPRTALRDVFEKCARILLGPAIVVIVAFGHSILHRAFAVDRELAGTRHAGTEWVWEYEIAGMSTPGIDSVRACFELRYDAMPDLHVGRVTFLHDGRVLAVLAEWWIDRMTGRERLDDVDPATVSPDWVRVLEHDGPALAAILGSLPEYPSSLVTFERLPKIARAPITMRVVDRRLVEPGLFFELESWIPGLLFGVAAWIAMRIARFSWRFVTRRGALGPLATILFLVASSASTVGCSSCESRLEADLRGDREAYSAWTYRYQIRGLETPGIDPLCLIVEVRYDAMPDLHVERFGFEFDGSSVVEFNAPWFLGQTGDALLTAIRAGSDSPDWHRLLAHDRATLHAIVGALPMYPKSLADLEALTGAVRAPVEIRIVDRRCR